MVWVRRGGVRMWVWVTFDGHVDRFGWVSAVECCKCAEGVRIVSRRGEVVSGRLHDGLGRVCVVCLCGEGGTLWRTRGTATDEEEEGEAERDSVDDI